MRTCSANAHDEALFDYYFTGQLVRVDLSGAAQAIGAPGLIADFSVSPDGRYLLTERLKRPIPIFFLRAFPNGKSRSPRSRGNR